MSLINDALRRANQAKKNQPADSGGEPMRPAEAAEKSNLLLVPVLLSLLLVAVISFAGWFFWRGLRETSVAQNPTGASKVSVPATSPIVPQGQEKKTTALPSQPAGNISGTAIMETNPLKDLTVPAEETAIDPGAVTNVSAADPAPPPLKLQGIFFRRSNPTVLINGKTLAVEETIFGARVTKITRQEVTLERDGKTIVLSLD